MSVKPHFIELSEAKSNTAVWVDVHSIVAVFAPDFQKQPYSRVLLPGPHTIHVAESPEIITKMISDTYNSTED